MHILLWVFVQEKQPSIPTFSKLHKFGIESLNAFGSYTAQASTCAAYGILTYNVLVRILVQM